MRLERIFALLHHPFTVTTPWPDDRWVDGSRRAVLDRPAKEDPELQARVVAVLTGPALGEAWQEAVQRMGPDPARWAWGKIHRASFEHPLAFTPALKEAFNLPDVPRGGDATTPNATGNGPRQTAGASYREIIDVGDWDRSVTINVPGESGQPGSPHYGDLLPLWAEGKYHPMAFSRAAVEKFAESKLTLLPAR